MRFCSRALATLAVAIAISTVGANTGFGQKSNEKSDEAPKVEVGKKAPDFTMTNIEEKSFKLSERLGKGKNIVLMFSRAHW
ncbi:MAG: hypothetical protein ACE361_15315 [Aureliella sp.]